MSPDSDISRSLMAFMTLKTIVFQIKENTFNFAISFLLLSVFYLISLISGKYDFIGVSGRCQKGLVSQNSNFENDSL